MKINIDFTEREIADLKYAVALMYAYSQNKNNQQGIRAWGVLAEKLTTIYTNVGGYDNDEDYINRHIKGDIKVE